MNEGDVHTHSDFLGVGVFIPAPPVFFTIGAEHLERKGKEHMTSDTSRKPAIRARKDEQNTGAVLHGFIY